MTHMVSNEPEILTPLAWDTQSFGFPVARVTSAAARPAEVAKALATAKAQGIRLVYWSSSPQQALPADILARFGGALVDRRATFRRDLVTTEGPPPLAALPGLAARVYTKGPASPALERLALAAGQHSRYRVDPRFPAAAFERLYGTWIERSAQGEIADAVLVLTPVADAADLLGMVTVGVEGPAGRIGLIAVDARARGQGLGRALMSLAHQWFVRRPCPTALVTTQLDNGPACSLYRSAGYQLDTLQHVHHFWPQGC
jgi:dTDP-4-amino-4,6-dideoxy-D-galactose acyltransferase